MKARKPVNELVVTKRSGAKRPNVTTRMPRELIAALNNVADREGVTRNEVVRQCVLAGLKQVYKTEVLLESSKPLPPKRGIELSERA